MIRRARYSSALSWATFLLRFSFALMMVMRPAAASALTIDLNQLSLFLWSPGVDTSINGTSALQQDIVVGPNNTNGGPFSDFVSQGFNVAVANNLNSNKFGSLNITITNPGAPLVSPVSLIAMLDADILGSSGGSDNNQDHAGPGTNHGSASGYQVDDPNSMLGNIIAGTLDNTDHIGSGSGNVSLALQYALGSFGTGDQISAILSISSTDNGGLRQHRGGTQLFFTGVATQTTTTTPPPPGPAPTPEPTSLVLLGTGAGITAFKRLRGRLRLGAKPSSFAALVVLVMSALCALPHDAAAACLDSTTLSATPDGQAVAARGAAYVRSIEGDSNPMFMVSVDVDVPDGTALLVFANGEPAGTIIVAGQRGTLNVSAPLPSGMDPVCAIGPVWVTDAASTVLVDGGF